MFLQLWDLNEDVTYINLMEAVAMMKVTWDKGIKLDMECAAKTLFSKWA